MPFGIRLIQFVVRQTARFMPRHVEAVNNNKIEFVETALPPEVPVVPRPVAPVVPVERVPVPTVRTGTRTTGTTGVVPLEAVATEINTTIAEMLFLVYADLVEEASTPDESSPGANRPSKKRKYDDDEDGSGDADSAGPSAKRARN